MEEVDLLRIKRIQEELKQANKALDEYFRKQTLQEREETLKTYSRSEKSAYWRGRMDANNENALLKGF